MYSTLPLIEREERCFPIFYDPDTFYGSTAFSAIKRQTGRGCDARLRSQHCIRASTYGHDIVLSLTGQKSLVSRNADRRR